MAKRGRPRKPLKVTTSRRFTSEAFLEEALDDVALEIRETARDNLTDMAQNLVSDIQLRTTEGRSVLGQFFQDYSPSYTKVKGRRQPVDLTLSGEMLQSVEAVPESDERIVITASDWKSGLHHDGSPGRYTTRGGATFKNPLPARPWFGVSEAGLQRFVDQFDLEMATVEQDFDFSEEIVVELTL